MIFDNRTDDHVSDVQCTRLNTQCKEIKSSEMINVSTESLYVHVNLNQFKLSMPCYGSVSP